MSEESLLPELLHALSQPLTALRCSLEVTLLQPRNSEEYRKRLRESLGLIEEIATLAAGIRELVEVEQPSPGGPQVRFDKILRSTVREWLPPADSKGVSMSLICAASLLTRGDTERFYKAIFYFMEFLLGFAGTGDELNLQAHPEGAEIAFDLQLSRCGTADTSDSKTRRSAKAYMKFLIARRIIEVEGGRVEFEHQDTPLALRIHLPLFAPTAYGLEIDDAEPLARTLRERDQ